MKKTSYLTLVGAGPGDPDLMTMKGIKALKKADIVLYDALVSDDILAYIPKTTPRKYVGKRCGYHSYAQEEINQLIVESALRYGHVVRLKGGDPFVFGRGYEEIEYAEQFGIKSAIIPGISSAIAAPASCGIPVTQRGMTESFWVVTATTRQHKTSSDIELAAQSTATMVILMGTRKLKELIYKISEYRSLHTPVALIQNATLPNQKTVTGTLGNVAQKAEEAAFNAPGIIVVGEVARLSPHFLESLSVSTRTQLT
ncbi:MAG: uroporphyrinogen-III C-methyltransferase [Bacteroidota bacterium]